MNGDVGVIIGTYGEAREWVPLMQRASASAHAQTVEPRNIIWQHADTLQHARNWGAGRAEECEYLIFLDADDELEPTYIEEMLKADGDIRRPSTRGVYEDGSIEDPPSMIPERNLYNANYIVIGAMCRAEMFFGCGGFNDFPILEDWDLWLRMVHHHQARVVDVPAAVYRIHVRSDSRNTGVDHAAVYQEIRRRYVW